MSGVQRIASVIRAQVDFSAGEPDVELKRSEIAEDRDVVAMLRTGARQCANWRALNSGKLTNRMGRRALFVASGRVDEIRVGGVEYYLNFGSDGSLRVIRADGSVAVTSGAAFGLWNASTIDQIVWTQVKTGPFSSDVVITFPGMKMVVASWDGATWTVVPFQFNAGSDGHELLPYFRVAKVGVTMRVDSYINAVAIEFSDQVLVPAHVGAIFRLAGRRIIISTVVDNYHATGIWIDTAYPQQTIQLTTLTTGGGAQTPPFGATDVSGFLVGQEVQGSITGTKGAVIDVIPSTPAIVVQVLNNMQGFITKETLTGPSQVGVITGITNVVAPSVPHTIWDEQLISDARGWPRSCASDAGRLIFCDIPSLTEAILWSVNGAPYNFSIGAEPDDAICEVMSGRLRIYHVLPAWIDEMIFTDFGVFFIPVSPANPLKPGGITFQRVSDEPASQVRPIKTSAGFLCVNAGSDRVISIVGSGTSFSTRPYVPSDLSRFHTHLFANGIKTIAVTSGDGTVPEKYVYALMRDSSIAIALYDPEKKIVGWMPWSGAGMVTWLSALRQELLICNAYPHNAFLCETLDKTEYLDGALTVNNVPSALHFAGKGPLWWMLVGNHFATQTTFLMDGTRPLGTYGIDATGNLIKNAPDEDLSSVTLIAGQPWTSTFEPFVPGMQEGQDSLQRMRRRRVARFTVYVIACTGFLFARLYSGPLGTNLPAAGAVVNTRRIPGYNTGDNASLPPPSRETTEEFRPLGRSYDPRFAIIKDVPGPMTILENGMEVTV